MNRAERLEKQWTEYLTQRRSREDIPYIAREIAIHFLEAEDSAAAKWKAQYEAEKSIRESCQTVIDRVRTTGFFDWQTGKSYGQVDPAIEAALRKIADLIEETDEIIDAEAFVGEIFEIAMKALVAKQPA